MNEISLPFSTWIIPTLLGAASVMLVTIAIAFFTRRKRRDPFRRRWINTGIYLTFVFSVAVLAASSFSAILSEGKMEHDALMIHVAASGLFVCLLFVVALTYLPRGETTRKVWWWEKWNIWGLVVSGLIASVTMLLSMLPLLDSDQLGQTLHWHRLAGLATVIFLLQHLAATLIGWLGWR